MIGKCVAREQVEGASARPEGRTKQCAVTMWLIYTPLKQSSRL